MISVKCNYYIYNKKLLIIIHCFKHWCSELKHTDLLIQVFTDHQTLKTFMKNKKLTYQQTQYLDILSDFNFQVIFWSDKINDKADVLTSDCVKIQIREVKNNLIKQIISLSPFYLNKDFYLHMSFDPYSSVYEFTHKWLQSVKAENITTLKRSRESMKVQANKYQKNVSYTVKDKQLRSLCVSQCVRILYCLRLQTIMRVHNQTPSLASIIINNKEHWGVNDTLNSKHYCERLQCKVK